MKIIDANQLKTLLPQSVIDVVRNIDLERAALVFRRQLPRTGSAPSGAISGLLAFLSIAIRWLPSSKPRVLWISSFHGIVPDSLELVKAARAALGDARSLRDAPGFLFDTEDFQQPDIDDWSTEHAADMSWLLGLLAQILLNGWDGWLLTSDTEHRIEFWEGNIFFYSSRPESLLRANALLKQFGYPAKPA